MLPITEKTFSELSGDSRRQAVSSIRGTVYQAWCSIDAWLRLNSVDQVIYLEGAEDFDVVNAEGAIAVQVKHNEAPISLGTKKAKEALENFWELTSKEQGRQVDFHFLTTSPVAKERDGTFGDICGLDAWRAACTSQEMAMMVGDYLKTRLLDDTSLRQFIETASTEELQNRLFRRFSWLTDQPSIEAVQQSVDERIIVHLHERGRGATSLVSKVRVQLESQFWQIVTRNDSRERCLTFSNLLKQFEEAITTYLPIPVEQLPELLEGARPGFGILRLLTDKVPQSPSPLIQRTILIQRLEESVKKRCSVLVTGTVFKGKSTIAQLVANTLCPNAWWIKLTELSADQVNLLFRALASKIDNGECPSLVVVDDIDIGPGAYRVYSDALTLVLHRAKVSGRAVLLTARGGSSDAAQLSDFRGIDILEIPELTTDEVTENCLQEGCSPSDAELWGVAINALSSGHPKLVQVQISELSKKGWPRPQSVDFGIKLSAGYPIRQMARRLLNDSVSAEVVEFLYCASESTIPLHRSAAIRLAELVDGIRSPGDLLDELAGRWLECIDKDWYRTTPILRGAVGDAWSAEQRALAHVKLHDSILHKKTLDPVEGAALLYHAYFGKEPQRIAQASLKLQTLQNVEAQDAVERNLLWLPYVATDINQRLCDDNLASAALRGLQFRVAATLDAHTLSQICARWSEETALVQNPQLKQAMQVMMWNSIAMAQSPKLLLRLRLDAIKELRSLQLTGVIANVSKSSIKTFFDKSGAELGIPVSGTQTQVLFLLLNRWVKDAATLEELIEWLDLQSNDEIRHEFENTLSWPLMQTLGAFIHGAWAAVHEKVADWHPWLELFDFIDDYAKRRDSPLLGREVAKAKAIILTEYLDRADDALQALLDAESSYGNSPVLDEQRANTLFQVNDDIQVLAVWNKLVAKPASKSTLDPFAYRRAAISATRLGKWELAETIFHDGIESFESSSFAWTKFGMMVDRALTVSLAGNQRSAADLLSEAVMLLPTEAADDGNEYWEAVQRAAFEVCNFIHEAVWDTASTPPKLEPGRASSPGFKVDKCEPGQAIRTSLLRAHVANLSAEVGVSPEILLDKNFYALRSSPYPLVRWLATQAQLAHSYSTGAGEGFIEALTAFDATFATLGRLEGKLLIADEGLVADQPKAPEQWFGLLIAGICCAGRDIDKHLDIWLKACSGHEELNNIASHISQFKEGSSFSITRSYEVVGDIGMSKYLRCGAAAKLLFQPLQPNRLLSLQGFLVSGFFASGEDPRLQQIYNLHVARQFAQSWKLVARNPFNLLNPKVAVPILNDATQKVLHSCGTLNFLISSASKAIDYSAVDFGGRLS